MNWDVNDFINKLKGGFESGQLKRDEEAKLKAEEDKVMKQDQMEAQKAQDLADKKAKAEELHQFKTQKEQLSIIDKMLKMFGISSTSATESPKKDGAKPTATPTAKPTPDVKKIAEMIKAGLEAYAQKSGYENPLATMSGELAQGAVDNNLPDPYMPPTMNLMETGGSKHMAQPNNYFNWGTNPKPDINTSIDRMITGVGNTGDTGLYQDYLKTGEMSDFFKKYTPSSDPKNPNYDELMKRYTQLRGYFPDL